jgi:hypothetical protein
MSCQFSAEAHKRGGEWNRCRAGIIPTAPFMFAKLFALGTDLKRDVLNTRLQGVCQYKNNINAK